MAELDPDEALLLALLNSTPVVNDTQQDELGDIDQARAWLRAHGGTASTPEWHATRSARAALQAVIRGEQSAAGLSPQLNGVSYRPSATDDGVAWQLDVEPARSLAVRAVLAWSALHETGQHRLRPCANPDCRLFLLDHSKANNARWCSMAVCGNRMKARRHHQRARETGTTAER